MDENQINRWNGARSFSSCLPYSFAHLFIYLKGIRDDRLKSGGFHYSSELMQLQLNNAALLVFHILFSSWFGSIHTCTLHRDKHKNEHTHRVKDEEYPEWMSVVLASKHQMNVCVCATMWCAPIIAIYKCKHYLHIKLISQIIGVNWTAWHTQKKIGLMCFPCIHSPTLNKIQFDWEYVPQMDR